MDENITIGGRVFEIIYQNTENGYTVCEIDSPIDGLFTATGYMPYLSVNENILVTGTWTVHPDYGEQLRVSYYETVMPTDEQAIIDYLASGIIYGIREATAKKIVERFGTETLNIMLTDPMRLSEIKGISASKAEKIGKSYLELQSMQNIIMFLQQYDISTNLAVKVHQALGSNAVNIIKENPYILADAVEGISFKTADNIAHLRGLPKNHPMRIQSCIKYILNTVAYNYGHTYLPEDTLIKDALTYLAVSEEEIQNGITALELKNELYRSTVGADRACYLSLFYTAEQYTARRLASLSVTEPAYTLPSSEIDAIISDIEVRENIELDEEQKKAVYAAVYNGCAVITGGPGTGKTTTINTIIKVLGAMNLSVALAAPTGRAAKRMSQVTGIEAKTIHRLLGMQPGDDSRTARFTYNESNPLIYDVIILDEVSMVDILLMHSFLKAVKRGAKVIFSGDSDQLPSVGAGNVLKDIIDSNLIPVIHLKHIFRQARESLIVMNAHKINCGIMPDLTTHNKDFFFLNRSSSDVAAATIIDLYRNRLPQSYGFNPLTSIQVLSPSKKGDAGSVRLNHELQKSLNPPDMLKQEYVYGKTIFRVGDKVMQIKNNYDIVWTRPGGEHGSGIFNGDMGIIDSISVKDRQMIIIFDDDKETEYSFNDLDCLDLAYAITVHKSQGSEFPVVIIPMCHFAPMLMCRNLLYTAVTRAKNMVILVGMPSACAAMVRNNDEKKRFTGLCAKLKSITEFNLTEDKQ
ncbi:MAG: ATP-dependent RecD-like DNA helicase [Clostridiales bacterium]|nr:ATP-dependent RecD-like DNA helicase [Clostridiales bacterium]